MFDPDEWLEIGKIVAPQGLRGEMRIYPSSDFPERFLEPGERWLLRPGGDRPESVQIVDGRFLSSKGLYIIQLEGITTREQAETLRNSKLMVLASDRPPLEEGEFHVLDLVGLPVYHQVTEQQIGVVRDVLSAGNDLLEVELLPALATSKSLSESEKIGDSDGLQPESDSQFTASHQIDASGNEKAIGNASSESANPSMRRSKARRAAKNAAKRAAKKAKPGNLRVLIPFVEEIVPIVDLESRRIEILPPTGLIESDSASH